MSRPHPNPAIERALQTAEQKVDEYEREPTRKAWAAVQAALEDLSDISLEEGAS